MQSIWILVPCLALFHAQAPAQPPASVPAFVIEDFELPYCHGIPRKRSDWRESRLVVVVFLGTDCPLVELYAGRLVELAGKLEPRGVAFVGIDSNAHDSLPEIAVVS